MYTTMTHLFTKSWSQRPYSINPLYKSFPRYDAHPHLAADIRQHRIRVGCGSSIGRAGSSNTLVSNVQPFRPEVSSWRRYQKSTEDHREQGSERPGHPRRHSYTSCFDGSVSRFAGVVEEILRGLRSVLSNVLSDDDG